MKEELPPENNPYKDITFYSGIGKCNATFKITELIHQYQPEIIVNYGTVGSCHTHLSGLIECGIFLDRDDVTQLDQSNHDIIINPNLYSVATGDNFVTQALHGCDVVDMESYCLAKVCKKYNIKFKSYKYITDYVNETSLYDWKTNISKGYPLFLEKINAYIKNAI